MKPYYSKKVIEHFLHPRFIGKIKKPNGVGKVGNPLCGDILTLYIKVEQGKIENISYETLGCAAAISVSDILCEMVKGKTLNQALKINFQDIVDKLRPLPPIKIHCTRLGVQALRAAIEDYKKRKK